MTKKRYSITQDSSVFELRIESKKYKYRILQLAVGMLINSFFIILSLIFLIGEFSMINLFLGALMILIGLYIMRAFIDTYIWIKRGEEYLRIDKKEQTFYYEKRGRTNFDVEETQLANLSNFQWGLENFDFVDVHPRDGMVGGKICFWISEKRVRFGIGVSDEEAKECIEALNGFIEKDTY